MLYSYNFGSVEFPVSPNTSTHKAVLYGSTENTTSTLMKVVAMNRDTMKIIGSCIVNPDGTWEIHAEYDDPESIFLVCFDETGQYNSTIFDYITFCDKTFDHNYMVSSITGNTTYVYRKEIVAEIGTVPYNGSVIYEDVKDEIDEFIFDTVGVAGRFTSYGIPVDISSKKICADSEMSIGDTYTSITTISGTGTNYNDIGINNIKKGHSFNIQILGDSSCILLAPFYNSYKGYGYDHTKIASRVLGLYEGKDSYSLSYGSPDSNTLYNGGLIFQDVRLPTGDYTFSMWFYSYNMNYEPFIAQNGSFFIHYTSGYFNIRVNNNNSTTGAYNVNLSVYKAFTDKTYNHLIIAMGSAGCQVWINGVSIYTNATNCRLTIPPVALYADTKLSINTENSFGQISVNEKRCNKRIFLFRVFNKKISDAEATVIYNTDLGAGGIAYTAGGTETVHNISNIKGTGCNLLSIYNKGNNTAIVKPQPDVDTVVNVNSIDIDYYKKHNLVKVIYKGDSLRQMYLDASDWYQSTPNIGFMDDYTPSASAGGVYIHSASTEYTNQFYMGKHYFQIDFQEQKVVSAVRFRTFNYSSYYDYPNRMEVYTSNTGSFCGEEIYRGIINVNGATAQYEMTNWAKFDFFSEGRYYRFVITGRSSIYSELMNAGRIGFRSVYFEVSEQTHKEAVRARSIVIDIANNYGSTSNVSIKKVVPSINGEPVSTKGWSFYQTSNSTVSNKADRSMDVCYSYTGYTYDSWISASSNVTNQRLIAVAPEEFDMDDIIFVNYSGNYLYTDTNFGAKDTKIRITKEIITDTTYNATISGSTTIFSQRLPSMYLTSVEPSGMQTHELGPYKKMNGFLCRGSKIITARAITIDIPSNLGDANYVGIKKVEFYLNGVRVYIPMGNITGYCSSGNSGYITNTFTSTYQRFGAYASPYSWRSASGSISNQRIGVLFSSAIQFDTIIIYNHTNPAITSDFDAKMGAERFVVRASKVNTPPPIIYDSDWDGSVVVIKESVLCKRVKINGYYIDNTSIVMCNNKKSTWLAKSVVFDIHSNHEGSNCVGVKQIGFLLQNNILSFRNATIYSTSGDVGFEAENAFKGTYLIDSGAAIRESWFSSSTSSARIIVVFERNIEFDEISSINWSISNGDNEGQRYKGIKNVTIKITENTLTSEHCVYNTSVPDSITIFDGVVRKKVKNTQESSTSAFMWSSIVKKDQTIIYSNSIELLLQSNTIDGSTVFNDSSYMNHSISYGGTPYHSTTQSKIGTSSICTISGYLTIPFLSLRAFNSTFSIGMWIYPTNTTGDRGLVGLWGDSGNYSYLLSVNNGYLEFKYSTTGLDIVTLTGSSVIPTDTWSWVEVRRAGDYLHLFCSGTLVGTSSIDYAVIYRESTAMFTVGSYNYSTSNCFQGYIQEVILRTGIGYDNVPYEGPGTFTSIIINKEETNDELYTSLSFDDDYKTYNVFSSYAWRPIVSKDPTIHGVIGDDDWYYRDDYDTWHKDGIYNECNAISKAVLYENNRMTVSGIRNIDNTKFNYPGGCQGGITPAVALTFELNNSESTIGVNDVTFNSKKYWTSGPISLKDSPVIVSKSIIDWTVTKEDYFDNNALTFINNIEVHNLVGSMWVKCDRLGSIPATPIGTTTSGVNLRFRVTYDAENELLYRKSWRPTIYIGIN